MGGGDTESHSFLCSVKAQKLDTTLVWGGLCFPLSEMISHTYFKIFYIFDILAMPIKLFLAIHCHILIASIYMRDNEPAFINNSWQGKMWYIFMK